MNNLNQYSLEHPCKTIVISFFSVFLLAFGILNLRIDDDFVNMFPEDIPSKNIWDEVQNDFGSTEYITVAFGNRGQSILNDKKAYDILIKIHSILENNIPVSKVVENRDLIERVISINQYNIMDFELKNYSVIGDYNKKLIDHFVSKDNDFISLIIVPSKEVNNTELVDYVKKVTNNNIENYDIYYAGQPYLTGEIPGLIQSDVRTLMLIGISVMLIVLGVNLRSFYMVFCILLIILGSLMGMIGFMGWMYALTGYNIFHFTILSTSMPIILLTIANSDGVHIVSRFRKNVIAKNDVKMAMNTTLSNLKTPIFLTSVTTAIAFLTMISSPIPHMAGYGVVIAFGVLLAWVLSTTLLPSLIIIKKWNLNSNFIKESLVEKIIKVLSVSILRYPKRVIMMSLIIVGLSFIGMFFVKVEVNIIKFFKEGTSIRQSTDFIDNNMSGSMSFVVKVDGDFREPGNLKLIDSLKTYINQEFEEVNLSMSYSEIIKEMNQKNAAFWGVDNSEQYYKIPSDSLVLSEVMRFPVEFGGLKETDINSKIYNIVDTLDYNQGLIISMMETVSTERATEIAKKVDKNINSIMKKSTLKSSATGLLVFLKDFVSMVVQSSVISITLSVIIIAIISFLFFRKLYWALLSMIPLLSAIILNFGIMGLLGVELSHLTALLTAIIIGVGVDFAIHYISCYNKNDSISSLKKSSADNINLITSQEVGYPILLDVFSNMGFIALFFSAIIPLNYMGGLMVFAMISTSFGTLTIMSVIIELTKSKL